MGSYIYFCSEAYTIMTCSILSQKDNNGILRLGKIIIISLTVVQFIWLSAFVIFRSDKINLYTISPMDKSVTCNIGNFEYIPLLNDGNMPYTNMFTEVERCLTSNAEVTEFNKKHTNIVCHVKASDDLPGVVELPLLYYRGYKAYDIDTGQGFRLMKSGSSARLSLYVESGYEGNIKICYAGKDSWHVAEAVSLITFICIIILIVRNKKQTNT